MFLNIIHILFTVLSIVISILIFKLKNASKIALLFFVLIFLPSNIIIIKEPIQLSPARLSIFSLFISTILSNKKLFFNIPKELKIGIAGIFFSLLFIGFLDERLDLFQKIYRPFYVFIENFLLLALIYVNINKYKELIFLYKILFIYFFIVTIYGLLNYFLLSNPYYEIITNLYGGVNFFNSYLFSDVRQFRINSFIVHPITYGYFCVLLLFIVLQNMLLYKVNFKLVILIVLLLINILLTNSRTPIIAFLFSLILYFLITNIKIKIRIVFISLSIIFLALQINKSILIDSMNVFNRKETLGGSNLTLREIQLYSSYLLFKNKPLQGNGINYIFESLGYRTEEYEKSDKSLMGYESYIFKLLIEQGLLGILGNAMFFGAIFYHFFKKKNTINNKVKIFINFGIIITFSFMSFIIGTGELYSFQFSISLIALQLKAVSLIEKYYMEILND